MRPSLSARHGFTLIELSIVLVIIGLIIGGVLAGKDMITAAQIRKTIADADALKTAVFMYKNKFNALPGDDPQAQAHFGATSCPDYPGDSNPCSGDGNGMISGMPASTNPYEPRRATQHLALAGLIAGTYSGQYTDTVENLYSPSSAPGGNGRFRLNYTNSGTWTNGTIYGRAGNLIVLAVQTSGSAWGGALFTTPDAQNIDSKVDDGNPSTGSIIGYNGDGVSNCTTYPVYTYDQTTTSIACILMFWL